MEKKRKPAWWAKSVGYVKKKIYIPSQSSFLDFLSALIIFEFSFNPPTELFRNDDDDDDDDDADSAARCSSFLLHPSFPQTFT